MDDPTYLFVYGTLRRLADHPMAARLESSSVHIGEGRFQGRLYRVSWYPCAVASQNSKDIVYGDVFQIDEAKTETLFEVLDKYEGTTNEDGEPAYYRRERHKVRLEDGSWVIAWIYLFNRPVATLERIPSGDFLSG